MSGLDAVRARFARNEGLPFADILTDTSIRDVLNEHGVKYRDRVFNPVTTIWGFLGQVLSEDHSCRDAVSRIIAHRAANGDTDCSPNTASYCNARSRILTNVLSTLATRTAQELQASIAEHCRAMELERAIRVYLRWLHGFDAGHATESIDVPTLCTGLGHLGKHRMLEKAQIFMPWNTILFRL